MSIIETFSIIGLLGSLAKIGVNITSNDKKLLEWRFSEEGQKYYNIEETNKLYKAIEKGDTKLIDVIRKEKQKIITNMLKNNLSILFCILCMFMTSCKMFGVIPEPQHLDSSALLETEKTYQLENQIVKTDVGKKGFDGSWYVVHKDIIKTMNDNQDQLIKQLQINNDLKRKIKSQSIIYQISIVVVLISIFLIWLLKKKRS